MFDVNFSEFLILAVVALIVVGPKDLPVLMRTLGKYAGMARRQAAEFRAHFDDAMREAEMAQLREEMEGVRREVLGAARSAEETVTNSVEKAERAVKAAEAGTPTVSARKEG